MVARRVGRAKRAPVAVADEIGIDQSATTRPKMLVFISHDSRDADLAEIFANLLSDVSGGTLKSFRSSDKKGNAGIEFGAEWYASIMSQLGDATDVVALLTARSIDRPWILYEAGVAKGKLETTVLGLALGVPLEKVSTGPFGQFQNCSDDEDSLTKLVMQLLQRNPDASPREEAVRRQVKIFIEAAAKSHSSRPKKESNANEEEQGVAKLFEEVKAMVRELPDRVDDRVRSASRRRLKGRRIHPGMIEEMLSVFPRHSGPNGIAAGLLFVCSTLRDEVPWLYEPGMELYRALLHGNQREISAAQKHLKTVLEVATHSPWMHEVMRPDDEEMFYVVRHLPKMLERLLYDLPRRAGAPKSINSSQE